jgi:drug/metabolite transporter (DMT)-like permease
VAGTTLAWLTPTIATLFLYGLAQGFARKYVEEVSPARFCLFFIVARTIVALSYFAMTEHPAPFAAEGRNFLLVALLVYVLDGTAWVLYYKSILLGPITIVGTLSAAYPAPTILLAAIFLGERLGALQYVGVALVLFGCLGMAYQPGEGKKTANRGWIPLAVGALCLWAIAQTLLKYSYSLPQASESNAMLAMFGGGWLTLGVYGLLYGRRSSGPEPAEGSSGPANPTTGSATREWLRAMFPMVLMAGGDAGLLIAVKYGPVSIVTPLTAAYPVVTIVFAALVLEERVSKIQYGAIAAVLIGMYCII